MTLINFIDQTPTINMALYFEKIGTSDRADKLKVALAEAGCKAWDEEGRYIKSANVALAGIGGIAISRELLEVYCEQRKTLPGASAGMSYLNPHGKSLDDLYETVVGHQHYSIAHTATANLLVAGVTVGVENEFNSQRDILHMSRVTVARTGIQERPPIVVSSEELLEPTKKVVEYIDHITSDIAPTKLNQWESRNLLYPSSKATLFLATASLRNFQKLVSQRHETGKEL